jgi:hypothetical protein
MKPNFSEMNLKELRTYMLDHRDDDEAFYAYVDRSKAEGTWVKMPPLKSLEDLDNYPEFLESIRKDREKGSYSMQELQNLNKFGLTVEQVKKYQVLCLPENIETVNDQDNLIDASGTANFSKLLKEQGVKCANSYDLGLEASELERRGLEIWLGVTYILDKAVLPIVTGIISSLAVVEIQRKTKLSSQDLDSRNNTKIHIELRIIEEENSTLIKFEGNPEMLRKLLEGISDDQETKN